MNAYGPQALGEQSYQEWVSENIAYYQNIVRENNAYYRQIASENIANFRQAASENIAYYQEAASNKIAYYYNYISVNAAYYTQAAREYITYYVQAAKANIRYYLQAARLNMGYALNYVKESAVSVAQRAKHFVTHFRENATWAVNKGLEYTQYYASRAGHYIKAGFDNAQYYLSQGFTWAWQKLYQGYRWSYSFMVNRFHDMGKLIRGTWSAVKWVANGLWHVLKESVHFLARTSVKLFNTLKEGLNLVIEGIKKIPGFMKRMLEQAYDLSVRFIKGSWSAFKDTLSFISNTLKLVIEKSFDLMDAFIRNGWTLIKEGFKFLGRTLNSVVDFTLRALKFSLDFIKAIPNHIATMLRAIQSGLTFFKDAVVTGFDFTLKALQSSFAFLKDTMTQALSFALRNIRMMGVHLQNVFANTLDAARFIGNMLSTAFRSLGNQLLTMAGQLGQALKVMANGLVDAAKAIYQNFGNILPKIWEGICTLGTALRSAITPLGEAIKFAAGKALNVLGGITGVARFMLDKIAIAGCIVYAVADLFVGWVGSVLSSFVPQAAVSFLTTTLPFGGLIATGVGLVSTGLTLGLTLGTMFFAGYGLYRGIMWAVGRNDVENEVPQAVVVQNEEEVAANDDLIQRPTPKLLNQFEAQRQAQQDQRVYTEAQPLDERKKAGYNL